MSIAAGQSGRDHESAGPLRVCAYLRVSTGRQAESDLSIPDQRRQIAAFCSQKNWSLVTEYVEPGASATDDARPVFQAMIERATDTDKPFDVHLMIAPIDPYLEAFAEAGADIITVHPEAGPHIHRTLQAIGNLGKKAGVVLNPGTPVEALDYILEDVDLVLVMSVNPGFGGQSFIHSQLRKVEAIRKRIDALGKPIHLEVDGGVNAETARLCVDAGADVLVAGSATFKGGPEQYAANIAALKGGE